MYKVGELGDCFLLAIQHEETLKHLLIDCGSFRNGKESKKRMREIVGDIQSKIKGGKLDVVVGTHQHNDHVSGFVHAEDIFREIGVEQVWLPWLDNPRNKQASRIQENHLQLRKQIVEASHRLAAAAKNKSGRIGTDPEARKMMQLHQLMDEVMSFFGAAPQLPAKGIDILKSMGNKPVAYLAPGDIKAIPGIPNSAIKVHVLGPPMDEELLYRKDPRKGESYDHKLHSLNVMAAHFLNALKNKTNTSDQDEAQFPFNAAFKVPRYQRRNFPKPLANVYASYMSRENAWRNIDNDWLEQASRLALYMDTFTNNSSLVLAIELVKTGKVLLFAADAQIGNWLSWQDVKFKDKQTTTDSLLSRTVLYKVGHHGSHNATLKKAFEKMTSEELVAMIPVDKTDPNIKKKNGWKMPATNLLKRLTEKTQNRVLRMDDGYAADCNPKNNNKARASWKMVEPVKTSSRYIEFTVK
jgi:beta-lactamase superfamily II metal-dependent hydrolase